MTDNLARRRASFIAREGWIFIFVTAFFTLVSFLFGYSLLGFAFLFVTLFVVYFFRNPEREIPEGDNVIVSPADGKVVMIEDLDDNKFTGTPAKKVAIFMSAFNVHVNRAPLKGRVLDVIYHTGKFFMASRDKASDVNERNAIILDIGARTPMAVVQIAGFFARRIVCYLGKNDEIGRGERLGLIRFGSRVDLYLPVEVCIEVSVGDKVSAGSSVIGRLGA